VQLTATMDIITHQEYVQGVCRLALIAATEQPVTAVHWVPF